VSTIKVGKEATATLKVRAASSVCARDVHPPSKRLSRTYANIAISLAL
jgi:hypothetical protein